MFRYYFYDYSLKVNENVINTVDFIMDSNPFLKLLSNLEFSELVNLYKMFLRWQRRPKTTHTSFNVII